MEKGNKKLILGIIIGIILILLIKIIFSLVIDSSRKTEIRYYKDGKMVGQTSFDKGGCQDLYSCQAFEAENYWFNVELDSSLKETHIVSSDCEDEFKKRIGKQLEGYCDLSSVTAPMSEGVITNFECYCWSN